MGMEPGVTHELVAAKPVHGLPGIFVEDCTEGEPKPMRNAKPPFNGAPKWAVKLTVEEEEADGFKRETTGRCNAARAGEHRPAGAGAGSRPSYASPTPCAPRRY